LLEPSEPLSASDTKKARKSRSSSFSKLVSSPSSRKIGQSSSRITEADHFYSDRLPSSLVSKLTQLWTETSGSSPVSAPGAGKASSSPHSKELAEMCGWLNLKKHDAAIPGWKSRWVVLTKDTLRIYKNKTDERATEALCLIRSLVYREDPKNTSLFGVETHLWLKRDNIHRTLRQCQFEGSSEDVTKQWILAIQQRSEALEGIVSALLSLEVKDHEKTVGSSSEFLDEGSTREASEDEADTNRTGFDDVTKLLDSIIRIADAMAADVVADNLVQKYSESVADSQCRRDRANAIKSRAVVLKTLMSRKSSTTIQSSSISSLTGMLENCYIDTDTKKWIAKEYTRESVADLRAGARELSAASRPSSASPSPKFGGLDSRHFAVLETWDFNPFDFEEHVTLHLSNLNLTWLGIDTVAPNHVFKHEAFDQIRY